MVPKEEVHLGQFPGLRLKSSAEYSALYYEIHDRL